MDEIQKLASKRPPKTQFSVRLEADELEKLNYLCKKHKVQRAALLRGIISNYLRRIR